MESLGQRLCAFGILIEISKSPLPAEGAPEEGLRTMVEAGARMGVPGPVRQGLTCALSAEPHGPEMLRTHGPVQSQPPWSCSQWLAKLST